MNDFALSVLATLCKYLGLGMFIAGAICGYIPELYAKPGRGRLERIFGMRWPEFYTPKGRFYLILGWWLRGLGFVTFNVWVFFLRGYE